MRKLIRELLPTDADFNAFCLDYFPDVHKHFSGGMDRVSKINLLFEVVDRSVVAKQLQLLTLPDDAKIRAYWSILQHRGPPDVELAQSRREELEQLYLDREQRKAKSLDTSVGDQRIVEIKRLLRQSPKLQEGEVLLDRYRLLEVVGRGGFANIWQAMDQDARRLVAVKVLHTEHGDDARRIERFQRGARQMQGLDHPHIVRILDGPDEYHGFYFFVMDYFPGGDLSRAVISRSIDRDAALRAILQVGSALDFAHHRGLIHRDVKPHNILLDGIGGARLTDFDLVWVPDSTGGTRTGAMGTFLYAAPEEMEDASRVDRRADVYSLAMTALFVLHGKSLPRQVLDSRASFIDRLNCPEPIKALLQHATALDPEDRLPTIEAFTQELRRFFPSADVHPVPTAKAPTPLVGTGPSPTSTQDPQQVAQDLVGRTNAATQPVAAAPPASSSRRDQVIPALNLTSAHTPKTNAADSRRARVRPIVAGVTLLALVGGIGGYWCGAREAAVDPESEAVNILVAVEGDLRARRWPDVIAKTNRVLSIPAVSSGIKDAAQRRKALAEQEANAQQSYERFAKVANGSNYVQAIAAYREIPKDSIYRLEIARKQYDQVFARFVESSLKIAEEARIEGRCGDSQSYISAILKIEPHQSKALAAKEELCVEKDEHVKANTEEKTETPQARPRKSELIRPALLTVLVRPWAIIYLDGKKIQQTPLRNYKLAPGNHKIVLVNDAKGKREEIKLHVTNDDTLPEIKRNWE